MQALVDLICAGGTTLDAPTLVRFMFVIVCLQTFSVVCLALSSVGGR